MLNIEKLNYPHIGLFILSWFLVDRFVPIIISLSHKFNLLDYPGGYKRHSGGIPYLGGVSIFLAVAITILLSMRFEFFASLKPLIWIVICTFFIIIIGVIDDIKKVSAITKLIVLLGLTIILYYNGIKLVIFKGALEFLNIIVSTLWLAGVASAFNSIDNSDGICSGVTAIISFFLFLINWVYYNVSYGSQWREAHKILSYASITLCGATIGFLRYNFPPAKIFLGDNGSLSIGFFLGAISILGTWSTTVYKSFFIPVCLMAVPLFDITFTTILRVKNGWVNSVAQAIRWCGNDHLAHRLKALQLTDRIVAFSIYIFAIFAGLIAFVISNPFLSDFIFFIIVGLFFSILFLLMLLLDRIKVDISNTYK